MVGNGRKDNDLSSLSLQELKEFREEIDKNGISPAVANLYGFDNIDLFSRAISNALDIKSIKPVSDVVQTKINFNITNKGDKNIGK